MKKIFSSSLFYPLILILLCLFIAFKNYTPGTFLTGWDTLHPEFNFPLNFQRLIFGVWRSDQGLGDLSGHSAMADLPRVALLWLFHYIFPLNFLRYSYIFLCLIIGPLGFYYLIKHLFKKSHLSSLISFLSSLFYLFNLGTLQQFYVPFEMFPTQWAFLPLLILFSLKYLHSQKSTYLLIYSLLTLLATPQAYAAQLWYAFFGVYTLFLLLYTHKNKIKLKVPLTLLLLTLSLNSFWLLPNIYYALTSTQNPLTNKSNRLNSQEYLLHNRATGTLADTSLIKGFYFNWNEYNFQRKNSQDLTTTWNQHLKNIDVQLIGNLLFLISFSGLIAAFIKKDKVLISLSPFFIIPFFLLANSTPIIRIPFDLLLKVTIFQELFRFIFTKVSILFTFAVCLYFANTINLLLTTFPRPRFIKSFSIILIFSLLVYCNPYFRGQFISPIVRVNIPSSYFKLYQYLQKEESGRILSLPLNETDGWQYYSWNYQGSGFLWFGFPQSILDRDSDRWEIKNEEAYREFFYPLYSKNSSQFFNSLLKYNVQYLLWDQAVIPSSPKNRDQITFKYETQKILDSLVLQNKLFPPKQFDSVFLYQINSDPSLLKLQQINNFIGPQYSKNYWDSQYSGNDYLTTNTSKDTIFPLRNILTQTENINQNIFDLGSTLSTINLDYRNLNSINPHNSNLKSVDQSLQISALNSIQGVEINFSNLAHNQAHVLAFETKYFSGLPLRFCLKNSYTTLCTLKDQVNKNKDFSTDYYLIPPMDDFIGYTLSINAISLASVPSVSQIKSLSISSISSNPFEPSSSIQNKKYPQNYKVIFPNNSLIKISNFQSSDPDQYINLYQSYSSAWLAFYFDNNQIKLLPHYLLNNWANAWFVSPELSEGGDTTIYILFWPQILEFIGFILIPLTIFWFTRPKR